MIGAICIAGAVQGWVVRRTGGIERTLLAIAAVLLISPNHLADFIGAATAVLIVAVQLMHRSNAANAA